MAQGTHPGRGCKKKRNGKWECSPGPNIDKVRWLGCEQDLSSQAYYWQVTYYTITVFSWAFGTGSITIPPFPRLYPTSALSLKDSSQNGWSAWYGLNRVAERNWARFRMISLGVVWITSSSMSGPRACSCRTTLEFLTRHLCAAQLWKTLITALIYYNATIKARHKM